MDATPVLVRLPVVLQMTGLCRSTIYKLMAERKFPAAVKLTEKSVAWRAEELGEWCATRSGRAP